MAIGLTPDERNEYILEEDRALPAEEQTVFHLRNLTFSERSELENKLGEYNPESEMLRPHMGTANATALRAGLEGWENFRDRDGNDIPFERETVKRKILGMLVAPPSDDTLRRLTPDQVRELAQAVREGLRMTREDTKK